VPHTLQMQTVIEAIRRASRIGPTLQMGQQGTRSQGSIGAAPGGVIKPAL